MTSLTLACTGRRGAFTCRLDQSIPLHGITALFGPSGSGKTTALRMIAGLERACSGRISLGGETWLDSAAGTDLPAHRRGIGYVFQDARLFDHLSVAGNLDYAIRRASPAGPDISRDQVISSFGLANLLHRQPASLSGGERQRVAIARALLSRPRLLLMDEPLSALDLPRRAEVMSYIETLPEVFAIPVIYVTHAIDEVARLAGNIALINDGEVAAYGSVQAILSRLDLPPLTGRFEAGVVLDGTICGQDRDYALTAIDIGGQTLTAPFLDVAVGEPIRLRVRARDVSVAIERPTGISIRNILDARVEAIAPEPGTAFAEILLTVCGQGLRTRLTRRSLDELGLQPGMQVCALIKAVTLDRRLLSPSLRPS